MKVLMVTRERTIDKKYGLGKSLGPVLDEFRRQDLSVGYLCQADLGHSAVRALGAVRKLLTRLEAWRIINGDTRALTYGVFERLNMGRLGAKVVDRERYSHVHCHDPLIALGLRIFRVFKRHKDFRWGVTQHGYGSYTQALHDDGAPLGGRRMRFLRKRESAVLHRADWVIAPTRGCLAQLARDLSAYPTPRHWRAIPHPAPQMARYGRAEARNRLGWDPEAVYVIGVGRLAPLKDFPSLIKACARVRVAPVRVVIVGEGSRDPLRTLAGAVGVADRLSFAVGEDMALYYSAADVYVSTSLTESFGMANLEALAAGVPAVFTAVGGVPEVVGDAGLLVPPGDDDALARVLTDLVADPALRARLARKGLERIASWPSTSDIAHSYLHAYGERDEPASPIVRSSPAHRTDSFWQAWSSTVQRLDICPLPTPLVLPERAKALAIVPHPDDEALAIGGTLALLRRNQCQVRAIVVTDGRRGDPEGYVGGDIPALRERESRAALETLRVRDVAFLGYPDGEFRCGEETVAHLARLLAEYEPDWLFIPPLLDHHRDHVAVGLAVLSAWVKSGCRGRAFMWELWQALPVNRIVDITSIFQLRQQAVQCYALPLKYCDYTRVSASLCAYRGLYLGGEGYAEGLLELSPETLPSLVDHLLGLRCFTEDTIRAALRSDAR